jgi:hypothetical protein
MASTVSNVKTPTTPTPAWQDLIYTDPVAGALAAGFLPLGPANSERTRWRHRDVPMRGVETMKAVFAPNHATGVIEPVMASSGKVLANGKVEEPTEAFQPHFRSGEPVPLADIIVYLAEKAERERQLAGGAA